MLEYDSTSLMELLLNSIFYFSRFTTLCSQVRCWKPWFHSPNSSGFIHQPRTPRSGGLWDATTHLERCRFGNPMLKSQAGGQTSVDVAGQAWKGIQPQRCQSITVIDKPTGWKPNVCFFVLYWGWGWWANNVHLPRREKDPLTIPSSQNGFGLKMRIIRPDPPNRLDLSNMKLPTLDYNFHPAPSLVQNPWGTIIFALRGKKCGQCKVQVAIEAAKSYGNCSGYCQAQGATLFEVRHGHGS